MVIPYGVLAIASGVLLSGSDRAKMALTAGLTFHRRPSLRWWTRENGNGYEVPMGQAAPLFVVLIALTASGYLHMNDDEAPAAEA